MRAQESRKHHYVPEFLLRAWACGGTLNGYWWDARHRALSCKRLGPKAFCRELDLLLLKRHPEGRDTLENRFFGGVDTRGARARDRILEAGPRALSEDERCDLVRLLFSLEVRSPDTIESIRAAVTQLVESMDGDRELLDAMEREGESDAPSDWYAKQLDHTMGDRFLVNVIQHLVDNARIGGKLINARWTLVRLSERNGTLVLSDRPVGHVLVAVANEDPVLKAAEQPNFLSYRVLIPSVPRNTVRWHRLRHLQVGVVHAHEEHYKKSGRHPSDSGLC